MIRPLAISQHLQLTGAIELVVKARFATGLVVEVPGRPGMIFISDRQKGLLPEQIILREHDFAHVFQRNRFVVRISEDVRQFNLKAACIPSSYPLSMEKYAVLSHFLNRQTAGISKIGQHSLQTTREPEWEAYVQWFIGRGPGSTPSGDDILLGALCLQYVRLQQASALWRYFSRHREVYAEATTPLSVAYFDYAMQGLFASRVLQVVRSLFLPTPATTFLRYLTQMAQVGAHSGIDCLFGIHMALDLQESGK